MMNRYFLPLLIAVIAISCQSTNKRYITIDGLAQGTYYRITYYDSLDRNIEPKLSQFFEDFDNSLSIYNPNSLVSRFNDGDSTVRLDRWFIECFDLTRQISIKSGGLLDPTLRPLIARYGFGGQGDAKSLTQWQIDSMLEFVGYEKVSREGDRLVKSDPRIELDYNATAKGLSVDLISRIIDSMGIRNYLIDVGGEIFCRGINAKGTRWVVSVDTPFEGNFAPGRDTKAILRFTDMGLATSGNYRKYSVDENGKKVVHTIDPRTGRPSILNLLSATVIAPDCATADGFATACMVAGLDGAKQLISGNPELGALLIYSEGEKMKLYVCPVMERYLRASSSH